MAMSRSRLRISRVLVLLPISTVLLVLTSSDYLAVTPRPTITPGRKQRAPDLGGHSHDKESGIPTRQTLRRGADFHSGAASGDPITKLPLAVDGKETPQLIPDQLAYRHFIWATAIGAVGEPNDIARREFMLKRAGLSREERRIFAAVLIPVREELDQIDEQRRRQSGAQANSESLERLKQRHNQLLDGARARLRGALNESAVVRLDTYVREHVRRRIKVFGQRPIGLQ